MTKARGCRGKWAGCENERQIQLSTWSHFSEIPPLSAIGVACNLQSVGTELLCAEVPAAFLSDAHVFLFFFICLRHMSLVALCSYQSSLRVKPWPPRGRRWSFHQIHSLLYRPLRSGELSLILTQVTLEGKRSGCYGLRWCVCVCVLLAVKVYHRCGLVSCYDSCPSKILFSHADLPVMTLHGYCNKNSNCHPDEPCQFIWKST